MHAVIHPVTDAPSLVAAQTRLLVSLAVATVDHGPLRPAAVARGPPTGLGLVSPAPNEGSLEFAARLAGLLGAVLLRLLEAAVIAFEMAWDTWWALVLGFTITGAVQEFVSEDRLTDYLGDDGWREVGYGALFGASSSSCSFSAVATTRSLFTKGASAAASLGAFQFASTDLVLELALVVTLLLGWQFAAAEIVGGLVAVAVLAVVYRRFVPQSWIERARAHARALQEIECATCGMAADPTDEETVAAEFDGERRHFCCGGCRNAYDPSTDREPVTAGPELLSGDRWASATANAIREWDMLWRDVVLGFAIAGLLAAFVPTAWWTAVFGVGAEGSVLRLVSNVVLGAVVGVVTFLCSVGNVPFAVVLWQNGVSFGGVLAFIFADLVILPLVRTYRRYYGTRMAAVIAVAFFLAAVVAGLVVELVFGALGLVPPAGATGGTVSGTYTALFNVVAVPIFAVQVYVALEPEQRVRLGNRLAPHIAGIIIRTQQFLERIAYALEDRGLK
ncbi:permease [Haloterrigena sp. SYSU A121-1]|uniref:Permease n=1 Tax=Haloterrigena gelatinilytica TaxID=2741724 RepID=A0A8J8GQ98_9EURY|nr:permease [Haloterrigena gelatinilytica]NUB91565.1 permease [Haloterrigena gelatinilytica]